MYLDTDPVLSLVGEESIPPMENFGEELEKEAKTSIFTLLETCELMEEMDRELDYEDMIQLIEERDIEILPLNHEVLMIAFELCSKYEDSLILELEHFIHAAHSIHLEEKLVSPDTAYRKIDEIEFKDISGYTDTEKSKNIADEIKT